MKPQHIGAVLAGAVFAALACRGDPTASLRGGPKYVDLSANLMFLTVGGGKPLQVTIRDEQLNPVTTDVAISSKASGTATVVPDTTIPFPNGSTHNYIVTGVATGTTYIIVTAAGLRDSTEVVVQ